MSSLVDKIKSKATGKSSEPQQQQQQNEPSFGILPHPAVRPPLYYRELDANHRRHEQKTNDPRDLEPPQPGGGLNSKPEFEAFHARDPHVPSPQVMNSLPPAKVSIFSACVLCATGCELTRSCVLQSREELRARAQELNQN